MVKPVPRSRRGNTLMPRHPYPGHQLSRSCPDNEGGGDSIYGAGGNDGFGVKEKGGGGGGGAMRPRSRENRSPSPYNRDVSPHSYYRAHSPNSTSCSPHSRYSTSPHSPSLDNTGSSQVILLPRKSSPTSNYLSPPSTSDMRRSSSESNIASMVATSESNIASMVPTSESNITWEPPYTGLQLPTQNMEPSNLQFTCPVNLLPRDQHANHSNDVLQNRDQDNTQTVSKSNPGNSNPGSVTGDSSPTIIITSCDNESRNFLHMNRSVITVNKNHKKQQDTEYRAPFSPASPGTPESLNDYSSQNSPVESSSNPSQYTSNPSQYTSSPSQYTSSPSQYTSSPVHNTSSPVHNQQSSSPSHFSSSPVPNQQHSISPTHCSSNPSQYRTSPVPNQHHSISSTQFPSSPVPNHHHSISPTHYMYRSPTGITSTSSLSQAVNTIQLNSVEDNIRLNGMESSVHTVENMGTTESISLDDWMKINLATINQVLINNDKDAARRKDSEEVCEILQSTNKSDQLFEPITVEAIDEEFMANLLSG